MRYWIITSEYPPSYGGGIGTYCYHMATMLKQNGWEVTIFVSGKNKRTDNIQYRDGVRVIEFSVNRSDVWNYLGYDTALSCEFATVVGEYLQREGMPAILESQEYAGIAYYILQYKHLNYPLFKDLKVLITLHAPSFLYNDYNRVPAYQLPYFWIGEMERWSMQAADMLNAPSHFMTRAVQPYFSYSPLKNEIHVIPYPFMADSVSPDYQMDPRDQWFFFGKLTPQKGIVSLLKAFRNLFKKGWGKKLQLIGGGDHYYHPENTSIRQWIKKEYAAEIKDQKIKLLGKLSPDKWNKVTENGSVIIIPSIGDNYPFTVMESLNNGQLVLASLQGGQSELIEHGVNGFLFDHTRQGDLEEKVNLISSLSHEEIKTIRINAQKSVSKKHAYELVFQQKNVLIQNLLHQTREQKLFPFIRETVSIAPVSIDTTKRITGLLSVVIPYYNMAEYIEETLLSVYASSYKNLEVIVVNDGSIDEHSERVIKELQKKYDFILFNQENKGLAETRNAGACLAKGEFLAFIDADDKVEPSFYTKAIGLLQEKTNVSFVGAWVQYFDNSNGVWPSFNPEPPYILYYNTVCSGGLVYKKSDFLLTGKNDKSLEYGLEDWESVINMVENGYRGVVIPEKLYQYRIRKGSMARMLTNEKILYSIKFITCKHKGFYSTFAADLNGLLHANGPGYKINNPTLDYKRYGKWAQKFPFVKRMIDFAKRNPFIKRAIFKIYAIIKN